MQFKTVSNIEKRQFDIKEWNETQTAYFRGLTFVESLQVNDKFAKYRDKSSTSDERFRAAFDVAKMALVDESGTQLITEEDFEAVKNAPPAPLLRIWNYAIDPDYLDVSFKKK